MNPIDNDIKQLTPEESAVALLRCLLSYHERVTMNGAHGLSYYADALRLGIRSIETVYNLPASDLDFAKKSENAVI